MTRAVRARIVAMLGAVTLLLLALPGPFASAQESPSGKAIFESNCASCHQADGKGIPGTFPPLVDNAHVQDSEYVADVIRNGRTGAIDVNGTTYDSVMPQIGKDFTDDEVAAVIDYLQNELGKEAATPVSEGGAEKEAGFPWGLVFIYTMGIIAAIGVVTMAAGGRVREFTWGNAYFRGFVIFAYFFLTTVWLPSALIGEAPIADFPKVLKDIVISGAWLTALAVGIVALRYLQKAERI